MASTNSSASGVVYLDTTSAQAALDKLNTRIKEYDAELNKANTSAARRMSIETDRASAAEKVANVQQQIEKGLGATYQQQIAYVKTLSSQVKNLAVGSEEYKQKLLDLKKAQGVFDEMRGKINSVDAAQKEFVKGSGLLTRANVAFSSFVGNLAANAASGLVSILKSAVSESVTLALKGEGIKNAFERLNRPDLLDELRKATKGTVSDLNLMQKAVQANNFQIPLDTLATMLQFAQRRARETGESVDYLVESIVTGIARKSPLILDNLGINIQRIQKEFEKTGDFAKAAMIVVNDELSKAGPSVDLMADRVSRMNANFENGKAKVGTFFLTLADGLVNSYDAIFNHQELVTRKENELIADALKEAQDKVLSTVRTFNTNYSKADKDGRAKIVEQVKEQIRLTEFLEKQAMLSGETQLAQNLNFKLASYRKFINDVTGVPVKTGDTIAGIEAEINTLNQILKTSKIGSEKFIQTQSKIKELNKQLDDANGTSATKSQKDTETAAKKAEDNRKKADEKNKQLFEQYNQFIKGLNQSITDILTPEASKKFAAIFKQTASDLERLDKLAQGDEQYQQGKLKILEKQRIAIHDLYEEEAKNYKAAPEQVSTLDPDTLSPALRATLPKEPVKIPIEIVPEIAPEDQKDFTATLAKVINSLVKDRKAGFELNIANAKNPREDRDARLASLKDVFDDEMENKDLTNNQRLLKEKEYQDSVQEINNDYHGRTMKNLGEILEYASQVTDILGKFNEAANRKENAQLSKELKENDTKKAAFKKLLDSKQITQGNYNREIAALEKEADIKKEALAKKQFERSQKQQIAQAIINGALAVTSTLSARPGALDILSLGAFRAINIAIAVASTAAQIATIAAQKYATGGRVDHPGNGKINSKRNIPTQPNGDDVLATVRVGEVILNEEQQRRLGGSDTFRSIGVPGFAGGGRVSFKPFWQTRPYQAINTTRMVETMRVVKFAEGGLVRSNSDSNNIDLTSNSQVSNSLIRLPETLQSIAEINANVFQTLSSLNDELSKGLSVEFSLRALEKRQNDQRKRRDDSEFK